MTWMIVVNIGIYHYFEGMKDCTELLGIYHYFENMNDSGYNPNNESSSYFLSHVSKALDKFIANYDNIILIGDFNTTMCEVNHERLLSNV